MGLYDNIEINNLLLPVSVEEQKLLKDEIFQTKSLKSLLTNYYIDKNGSLYMKLHGSSKHKVFYDYTGKIIFKTYIILEHLDNKPLIWYIFYTTFVKGKLVEIKGGKEK